MSTSFFFRLHVGSGDQTWNSGSQACAMNFFNLRTTSSDRILDVTYFQFLCWNDSCSWPPVTYPYPLPVYSLGYWFLRMFQYIFTALEKKTLLLICVLFLLLACFTVLMVKMYVIYLIILPLCNLSFWLSFKKRNYLEEGLKDSIFLLGYRSVYPLRIHSDISWIPEPKSPKSLHCVFMRVKRL